ncbi:sugar ABC transporter ATP-binding protein [Halocella sp. SP3-1]|uniref:sugar ABC transporter ATP-binding protein n=1 Tax=Halocella sp. SP3-1 TaxID=2382161 RepID=UPI000F75876E|nr:sugar ABC transporter ATP-binding protein [Halocella sp. SP3-1]AZO95765.1 sugar ABC transporter ATP-binding protein [Halocella sp. SP3-1]
MLRMKGITKYFPGVKALENVDFQVETGEVHALIGANGAGKSTLMKILAGAYGGYEGDIFIDNNKLTIDNPLDAKNNGIVIVYQEVDTALIPQLTVAENIMMDYIVREKKDVFMDWKNIKRQAQKELGELGLDFSVNQLVNELTLSEKQMVLIGRAVFHKAKYLILDEPTAPLSVEETKKLFEIVKKLKKDGISIIFISHRLDEVFEICEKITVLKDGEIVGTYNIADMTIDRAVEKMLGRKLENTYPKFKSEITDTILEAKNLSGTGGINNINLKVRAGEIVGLAGLVGGGKTETSKLLFGEGNISQGEIILDNKIINPNNPADAVRKGLALVPEERRKEGILVQESVETNITLPTLEKYCQGIFMKKNKIKQVTLESINKVAIKTPTEKQLVANLSGGNQQKVAIGKWLLSEARVFIFDEPTKGVDVGSKAEIYELIGGLVKQGKGVIYASCEFSEILGLTDRVYVMYNGTIVKELITKNTTEEELLYYSAGGGVNEK